MDYVKFIYLPLARGAARQALVGRNRTRGSAERGRFTRLDVDRFLKEAWQSYDKDVAGLPREPTIGSRMNVRLACFTMSFFQALTSAGTDRPYAIELVSDAVWRVYRVWSIVASALAHLTPGKKTALAFAVTSQSRHSAGVSLTFPFNAPATSSRRCRSHRAPHSTLSGAQLLNIFASRTPSICVHRRGVTWTTR